MAYFAPYVDQAGLHTPQFSDIQQYLIAQYQAIYGQSVSMENDDADYQWINNLALMINDAFNTLQLAVNGRSPATAIGADLDTIVKINGITRKSATYSTVILTLTGTPSTELDNAVAQDANGFLWSLPPVVILSGGSVNVTATCQTSGPIAAAAGTINIRSTPIAGWLSVTNANDAVLGSNVESDSQLRARQALSVTLSAKTLVDSTIAAIAATAGVTRWGTVGVENPTGAVDSYGNPAHSISMVVEGGTDLDVATAIYNNKTPGCLTNGTTTVAVTDPNSGNSMNISFFRPTYVEIYVTMNIHPLTGWTSATQAAVQNAVNAYINGLQIGEELTISGLIFAAMSVMPNALVPQFSIKNTYADITPTPIVSNDIPINFNAVAANSLVNVIINLV